MEKRRRRKQERDRKKRKRRELRAKEKAAKAAGPAEAAEPAPAPEAPGQEAQGQAGLLFNKVRPGPAGPRGCASGEWGAAVTGPPSPQVEVEVEEGGEQPASKAQRRKEKRQKLKGNLPPLTGRNYRQLLERLQARQERLEALREQDAGKARALESKMQWTTALYRAEGVRVRDDERLLQAALKRKEQRRAQRQRRWEKRTAHVVEKMQRRQEHRRQNLRKKKAAKAERRLEKARKKGRVLPQDLERAGLA